MKKSVAFVVLLICGIAASAQSVTLWVLTTPATTGSEVWQSVTFDGFTLTTDSSGHMHLAAVPGVTGPQGPKGATGPVGPIGPTGSAAVQNPPPTVTYNLGTPTITVSTGWVRISGTDYQFVAPQTITFIGTPTLYVYVSDSSDGAPAGTLSVAAGTATGVTCASTCLVNALTGYYGMPLAMFNGAAITDMRVSFGIH